MRYWTCRKCRAKNPRRRKNCPTKNCPGKRPAPRAPKHKKILDVPYELWAEVYPETCNICGAEPKSRRLDRDHCHKSGDPRGLLCPKCNRALANWMTPEWLRKAADYLDQPRIKLGTV